MIYYPPKRQPLPSGLRIICVKWGDKYGPEYVENLKAMCERHIPHAEFVCVTESPVEGVDCNPLVCDLPGWWQKVGLFQRGMFPGWNLYLDLDVVITEEITPVIAASRMDKGKLWCVDDFSYSLKSPRRGLSPETQRLLGGEGTIQSSVMLWCGCPESRVYKVWDEFAPEKMDEVHGDQNWITQALYPDSIGFLPEGYIQSYKYGQRKQAPLVVFHGDPKPDAVGDEWVRTHWAA